MLPEDNDKEKMKERIRSVLGWSFIFVGTIIGIGALVFPFEFLMSTSTDAQMLVLFFLMAGGIIFVLGALMLSDKDLSVKEIVKALPPDEGMSRDGQMIGNSRASRMMILAIVVCALAVLAIASTTLILSQNTPLSTAPTAIFTAPPSGYLGENLIFNGSASDDNDGTISFYNWSFGDGHTENVTTAIITHSYSTEGIFNVSLTVIDNEGKSNTTIRVAIEIFPAPPVLTVRISPSSVSIANGSEANFYPYALFKSNLSGPAIEVTDTVQFAEFCEWATGSNSLGTITRCWSENTSYFHFIPSDLGSSILKFTFKYTDPNTSIQYIICKEVPITVTAP